MDYLRATSDEEMREIGPSPPGCGANHAILRCHPRLWAATAFGFRLVSTPRTKTCPWGPRSGAICVRNPGSPARGLCALGWNAAHAKVHNRLQGEGIKLEVGSLPAV